MVVIQGMSFIIRLLRLLTILIEKKLFTNPDVIFICFLIETIKSGKQRKYIYVYHLIFI